MDSEIDYCVDEAAEGEGADSFRPGARGTFVRLLLLVLLLWMLIQMVLPRQELIHRMDLPPRPPAEPIEPNYWL
jgi:hypothetical protein